MNTKLDRFTLIVLLIMFIGLSVIMSGCSEGEFQTYSAAPESYECSVSKDGDTTYLECSDGTSVEIYDGEDSITIVEPPVVVSKCGKGHGRKRNFLPVYDGRLQ